MRRQRSAPARRQKLAIVLLLVITAGLATACWDYRDLEERAFVVMIGVDRVEDGVLVTAQLTVPILSTQADTTDTQQGQSPYRVVSARAPSVREALAVINSQTYRELDFGQLLVIIIGEELAREGLSRLDWLVRSPRVRLTSFIAAARGEAAAIVSASTPAEPIPVLYLKNAYLGTFTRAPEVFAVTTWQALMQRFYSPYEDVIIPGVATEPYGLNFAGLALFSNNRLVGWLDPRDTAELNTLMRERMSSRRSMEHPSFGILEGLVRRGAVSYRTRAEGSNITLELDATLFMDVADAPALHVDSIEQLAELENILARDAQQSYDRLLARLQELGTDPMGFGERLRRSTPNHPALTSSEAWKRAYSEATRNIEVRIRVRTRGRRD